MPVVPQYESGGNPGMAFNQGQEAGTSLMERAQRMSLEDQQAKRQKIMFDLALPVIQAKQQADGAVALNQLEEFKSVQNLRQRYLPIINEARTAFHDSQMIPDINARAAANTQWLAKYAPIANLPEYSKEFQTYQHLATQTTQDQMKIATLANMNDMTAQKLEAAREMSENRLSLQETMTQMRLAQQKEIADLKAQIEQSKNQNRFNATDPQALNDRAVQLEQMAQDETDPDQKQALITSASQYRNKATRLTQPIQQPGSAFLNWATGGAEAAPANQRAPSAPAAVTPTKPAASPLGDLKF